MIYSILAWGAVAISAVLLVALVITAPARYRQAYEYYSQERNSHPCLHSHAPHLCARCKAGTCEHN